MGFGFSSIGVSIENAIGLKLSVTRLSHSADEREAIFEVYFKVKLYRRFFGGAKENNFLTIAPPLKFPYSLIA